MYTVLLTCTGLLVRNWCYVDGNAFSFGFVFGVIENALIDLRPHHRFHTVFTKTIRMPFHLSPLSREFSNLCSFAVSAQRLSVDRRPKCIETYAVSNENALVWT